MMTNTTYKQTEIGRIPEDWELRRLGEIGFFLSTNSLSRDKLNYEKGNIYNIHYGDIHTKFKSFFVLKRETVPFINLEVKLNNFNSCEEGDLVIADASENETDIGKGIEIGIIGQSKVLAGLHTLHFRPLKSFFTLGFLGCLWQSSCIKNQILKESQGTKVLGISSTRLKDIKIPLPPLPEQTAIAAALSDADAYIDSLEQLLEKKRQVKQGAMQELLQPGEGWEVKRLGEVCDVIGGGTPSTFLSTFWNGNIKWFTPTEVGMTKYLFESRRTITQLGLNNSSANILPVNSILLTSRAGIGDLGILKTVACTNQGFQSLICKSDANYEFIYYLMHTKKNDLLNNASGSTFLEISPNKVKSLEVSIPSLVEQARIATILSDMDAELAAVGEELEKARQMKQGMMQELLTGRVRLV